MSEENNSIEIVGKVVEEKVVEPENKEIPENKELEVIETQKEEMESEINGINISEEVVATIAGIAASEVNGVASMNGGIVGGLSEMLGKKTKGVKVQVGEKDTVIDINLTVEYGARIPDIAWEVQNKVKTQVESMTGLTVVAVNIHVQGVSMPKKNKVETTTTTNTMTENTEAK